MFLYCYSLFRLCSRIYRISNLASPIPTLVGVGATVYAEGDTAKHLPLPHVQTSLLGLAQGGTNERKLTLHE
jgi:hypothetical protein